MIADDPKKQGPKKTKSLTGLYADKPIFNIVAQESRGNGMLADTNLGREQVEKRELKERMKPAEENIKHMPVKYTD